MKYRSNFRRPLKHQEIKAQLQIVIERCWDYAIKIKARLKLRDQKKEAIPQMLYDVLSDFDRQSAKWAALAFLQDNYPKEMDYALFEINICPEVRQREGEKSVTAILTPIRHKDTEIFGPCAKKPQRRKEHYGQRPSRVRLAASKLREL